MDRKQSLTLTHEKSCSVETNNRNRPYSEHPVASALTKGIPLKATTAKTATNQTQLQSVFWTVCPCGP